MSKMDNLRAMREAKYAAAQKGAAKSPAAAPKPRAAAAKAAAKEPVADPAALESFGSDSSAAADELCGHRNMGGRSCTREKGHTAKSHRYS
jgi:hypothetical protein